MKKIIILLSLGLFINFSIVNAQSTTATTKKEVSPTGQCTGNPAACTPSCTSQKASSSSSSTTLSSTQSNSGSVAAQGKVCTGKDSKGCCQSTSKASSLSKRTAPAKVSTSTAIAPKEAEPAAPRQ